MAEEHRWEQQGGVQVCTLMTCVMSVSWLLLLAMNCGCSGDSVKPENSSCGTGVILTSAWASSLQACAYVDLFSKRTSETSANSNSWHAASRINMFCCCRFTVRRIAEDRRGCNSQAHIGADGGAPAIEGRVTPGHALVVHAVHEHHVRPVVLSPAAAQGPAASSLITLPIVVPR